MLNDDFLAYWSAARLLASGGDPYDPAALLAVQRSIGWHHNMPVPVWYGPWVLAAMMPIGLLPYWPARVGWMLVQLASLLIAATILWRLYGGAVTTRLPLLLVTAFAPSLQCLLEGQITPLILLGFTGFLALERRRSDWLAGAALLPLSAKPLTLYLAILAIGVWSLRARRRKVLGGLALAVALASLAAVAVNPAVFDEWMRFSAVHSPLARTYTPTLGSILRRCFGVDRRWLAYLPAAIGLAWCVARWRRYGPGADWKREFPSLAFTSLLTAPFAWSHDALVLFPAVVQVAVVRWDPADRAFWLVANASAIGLFPLLRYQQIPYLLYPVALAIWWVVRLTTVPERRITLPLR